MPVRKRKPIEANDGSYGGMVLAAFDEMSQAEQASAPNCPSRERNGRAIFGLDVAQEPGIRPLEIVPRHDLPLAEKS